MQAVYKVASRSTRAISTCLLDGLFTNLKDDTLAFLAGIWTGGAAPDNANDHLCVNALRHATAFLKANQNLPNPLDFQVVLPSIITALHTLDLSGREAAVHCLDILVELSQSRPSAVYGFDAIYGDSSRRVGFA